MMEMAQNIRIFRTADFVAATRLQYDKAAMQI